MLAKTGEDDDVFLSRLIYRLRLKILKHTSETRTNFERHDETSFKGRKSQIRKSKPDDFHAKYDTMGGSGLIGPADSGGVEVEGHPGLRE